MKKLKLKGSFWVIKVVLASFFIYAALALIGKLEGDVRSLLAAIVTLGTLYLCTLGKKGP